MLKIAGGILLALVIFAFLYGLGAAIWGEIEKALIERARDNIGKRK